jgi:hypothetical protein
VYIKTYDDLVYGLQNLWLPTTIQNYDKI